MPPASSTTLNPANVPAYKIRTMAGDIETLKKGAAPAASSLTLKVQTSATSESPSKIKPAFPRIEMPVSPATKKEEAKGEVRPLISPPPLSTPRPQPFETPIKKPIMPPETNSQPKMAVPPLGLPTEPVSSPRPGMPLPRPVTPPPLPPQQPSKMPPTMPSARPALPPLPPLPQKPAMPMSQTKSGGSSRKIIWLGILAGVVLIFIGGEIWWFFLRQKPAPTPQSTEILPPPQALEPLLPLEETAPSVNIPETQPTVIPASGLLAYDPPTQVTDLADLPKINNETVGENTFVKLIVQKSVADVAVGESSDINTVDELIKSLKITIPVAVKREFSEEFDIFVFGGNTFDKTECNRVKNTSAKCYGPRLGLAIKVLDSSRISGPLKAWEKTMATDLKPLILAKTGSATAAAFQTGTYQSQNIRYKNLPLNTITVEYALVDDVLIITTSKSAMLKAIDATVPENSENSAGQNF